MDLVDVLLVLTVINTTLIAGMAVDHWWLRRRIITEQARLWQKHFDG